MSRSRAGIGWARLLVLFRGTPAAGFRKARPYMWLTGLEAACLLNCNGTQREVAMQTQGVVRWSLQMSGNPCEQKSVLSPCIIAAAFAERLHKSQTGWPAHVRGELYDEAFSRHV